MIIEYQRPTDISEALRLLARKHPLSYPLGGGTVLNRGMDEQIAVVDLQSLGLGTITTKGNFLLVGATVTLQGLLEIEGLADDIKKAIQHEVTYNLRQMATAAGKLVTANGRSPFATSMLALDASLEVLELDKKPIRVRLGDWLPLRESSPYGKLISMVIIPLKIRFAYEYIARTPADLPIVCAAVTQWDSGRTRLALGGFGVAPILAMDGPNSDGIDAAAKNAYSLAEDEWASAEYRQEMASVLAVRCLNRINSEYSKE
jgi:CO/xanthine dehydrogenase FAD-binding subunit